MPDLRINKVESSLIALLKSEAALAGTTLRAYIIDILNNRERKSQ